MPEEMILFPRWKELVKRAEQWEYGSFHSHDELSEILGVESKTSKYYQAIKRADAELLIVGKHFENIQDKGYYLINPDEFIKSSNAKVKKSARFFRHGIMISQHAPRNKMVPAVREATDKHTISISKTYSILVSETRPLFEIEQKIAARSLRSERPKLLKNGD